MKKINEPIWTEINLDHLTHNFNQVKKAIDEETMIMSVIKADAYGHGAVEVARQLIQAGTDKLAVARLNEAIELRQQFKTIDILVLGYTPNDAGHQVINHSITQTIYDLEQARFFNNLAKKQNKKMKVHVKIDSGMRRIGFNAADEATISKIEAIKAMDHLVVEGIYTHFATADEEDKSFTTLQYERFDQLLLQLEAKNITIPIKHVSNSATIIDLKEFNYDMVRAGIMLYGLYPSPQVTKEAIELLPVMSFKTKIALTKTVAKGEGISYGLTYVTDRETEVATLPIGYADGFTRLLSNDYEVLINNQKARVLGRICMDQTMIDVSGIDCSMGDEVTIFGENHPVEIMADQLGTINYEIVCMISRRVPRVYIKGEKVIQVKDFLLDD